MLENADMISNVPIHGQGLRMRNDKYMARCGLVVYPQQACPKSGSRSENVCPKLHSKCVLTMACLDGKKFIDSGTPKYVLERRERRKDNVKMQSNNS